MKVNSNENSDHLRLYEVITNREKLEQKALGVYSRGGPIVIWSGSDDGNLEKSRELFKFYKHTYDTLTSDILKNLNISVENLPQKCQNILNQVAESQSTIGIDRLDSVSISLYRSREMSEKLADEYEILKLRQKNAELQAKIDRNNRFINEMRQELECSRNSLTCQNPNPDSIQDYIRQMKQKLVSYEESYEKAKSKYTILPVPDAILPKSLKSQVTSLLALQEEAASLKQRADDVSLMKEARQTFSRLRR